MPLRRAERSHGRERPRWEDGSRIVRRTDRLQDRRAQRREAISIPSRRSSHLHRCLHSPDDGARLQVSCEHVTDARIEDHGANGNTLSCDPPLWEEG